MSYLAQVRARLRSLSQNRNVERIRRGVWRQTLCPHRLHALAYELQALAYELHLQRLAPDPLPASPACAYA